MEPVEIIGIKYRVWLEDYQVLIPELVNTIVLFVQ